MTTIDDELDPFAPPQDMAAEQSVLGAMLMAKSAIADVAAIIQPADFYRPAHETVYTALLDLDGRGRPTDAVAVADELTKRGNLARVGGAAYLHTLLSSVPTAANAGYYARIVRERAVLRRLVEAGTRIVQLGYAPDGGNVDDLVNAAQAEVDGIVAPTANGSWSTLADIWDDVTTDLDQDPATDGIPWGWRDVDTVLAPLRTGDLAVILAYSGGGKSVAACQIAFHASQRLGRRVLVHALEMTRVELGQRYAAALHQIPLARIVRGGLEAWQDVTIRESHLVTPHADLLIVDEDPALSLPGLAASIRRHKPDLVVVDQIPLMTPPEAGASREQQMTALGYGLKRLAKTSGVRMVACAQLNAAALARTDKAPTIHDIRESKAIGHAANYVLALHDPSGGNPEDPRAGEIEMHVLKARQGRNGDVIRLAKQYHYARLADLA